MGKTQRQPSLGLLALKESRVGNRESGQPARGILIGIVYQLSERRANSAYVCWGQGYRVHFRSYSPHLTG